MTYGTIGHKVLVDVGCFLAASDSHSLNAEKAPQALH